MEERPEGQQAVPNGTIFLGPHVSPAAGERGYGMRPTSLGANPSGSSPCSGEGEHSSPPGGLRLIDTVHGTEYLFIPPVAFQVGQVLRPC